MDKLKRRRRGLRWGVKKALTELEPQLEERPVNVPVVKELWKTVNEYFEKANRTTEEILNLVYEDEAATEEMVMEEMSSNDEINRLVRTAKIKMDDLLESPPIVNQPVLPVVRGGSPTPSENGDSTKKKAFHLPKIKLGMYNGEISEWLGFWAQFQNIHEDEELPDSTKFQYLKQSMVAGTKGSAIVNAYPQTSANYPKVIEELKDRCGDKVLLSEYYVRQLIKVLIRVNTGKGKEGPLSSIYDELESHLRSLESLGVSVKQSGIFLYPMIESSLPVETIKVWQRTSSSGYGDDKKHSNANERLIQLMKFLKQEVKGEERLNFVKEDSKETGSHSSLKPRHKVRFNDEHRGRAPPTVAGLFSGEETKCIFCEKGNHESQNCFTAKKIPMEERKSIVQKKRCCYICLRPNHSAKFCKSLVRCLVCGQKHATIMHIYSDVKKNDNEGDKASTSKEVKQLNANFAGSSTVYLGTFKTTVISKKKKMTIRGLYDPGAHRSYIGKASAKHMKLQPVGVELISHTLFGGVQTPAQQFNKFELMIENANGIGITKFKFLEKEVICGKLNKLPKGPWLKELESKGIWLNDLDEDTPEEIQLMIGADIHGRFLTGNVIQLSNGLTAQETILGWVVTGEVNGPDEVNTSIAMTVTSMHVADSSIEQLWNLETIGIRDDGETKSKEEHERATKDHFMRTVSRLDDGRYSVRLPWVNGNQGVPDNRVIAEKRLLLMTEKLVKQQKFADYEAVFNQWESEGFIEEVKEDLQNLSCCYLPHRAVFKPSSLTTPIRPVFDASCKAKRSPSLNDCLEKGPNLLEHIPVLLMRFREKKIGVTADIRKAFQMIEVHEEDRDYLRFLWWKDYGKKILKIYRHRRVVFGVNCSPFLLAAVIEVHLNSIEDSRRSVAQKLLKSFYVDNCVTSVDTYEEYEQFRDTATQLMDEAKMDLRVWQVSSREETGIGSLSRECGLVTAGVAAPEGISELTKVLGMNWDILEDSMFCEIYNAEIPEKFTKRSILSYLQQIFDPLGVLCPALLCPKKIMQQAWSMKTGWDEDLNPEQQCTFKKWMDESKQLKDVVIPRNFSGGQGSRDQYQLHCFCDASQDAYASVVYLKSEENGKVCVQLLMAKSRISPLKKLTIPRLELMACTVGARLSQSVKNALNLQGVPIFYWSDSSTALAWIKNNDEWGTFVGNRVREILTLSSPEDWRHVPGSMNPADLPSRGCNPSQLLKSRWWEGPRWLKTLEEWPKQTFVVDEAEVMVERRKTALVAFSSEKVTPWYAKFSSFHKNLRILAWIIRIIERIKKKEVKRGPITVMEIRKAEKVLLKLVQEESFDPKDQVIHGIKVTRDEDGLIRVESRLLYREDKLGFKKPVLLPSCHPVVDQLVEETHKLHGHAGVQFVMGVLREKYWILRGRKTVRRIISSCVTCRRYTAKHPTTEVASLPVDRVKLSNPFETIGVDLAGPLFLKGKEKVWIVLITCAVFRCVHLELVRSLSTDAFLDAFNRFMDRRGRPVTVYSDNGTNFVGAVNLFKTINWEKVATVTAMKRITWKFNPPSAAWWGGWWERLVRSMKDLLKRILGTARVTYDKLHTYVTSVEACLNGRPLTTVTEDQDDLRPLTPGMFLHALPSSSYTELDFISAPDIQQQLKERKTILDEFRSRFRQEYLGQLMQHANQKSRMNLKVGDVVLVGADHKKRWEWPIAKVIELFPGKDGVIRVAKVKTAVGVLTRPVQRLFPLEVSSPLEIPAVQKSSSDSVEQEGNKSPKKCEDQEVVKKVEVSTRSGRKIKIPKRFQE